MSKKQTAVEWLMEQYAEKGYLGLQHEMTAKKMEKEQINQAHYDGYYREDLYDVREYYNDTYKSNQS